MSGMTDFNAEELRASGALQDQQARTLSANGMMPPMRMSHAQLGTSWERGLALIGAALLLFALANWVWRAL
jgi:hypothetical protein